MHLIELCQGNEFKDLGAWKWFLVCYGWWKIIGGKWAFSQLLCMGKICKAADLYMPTILWNGE